MDAKAFRGIGGRQSSDDVKAHAKFWRRELVKKTSGKDSRLFYNPSFDFSVFFYF